MPYSLLLIKIRSNSDLQKNLDAQLPDLSNDKKLLLVTGHRRENFGDGFLNICRALDELAAQPGLEIVYPVHLNPNVQGPVLRDFWVTITIFNSSSLSTTCLLCD